MDTRVLKPFADRETGARYNAGYLYVGTAERVKELAAGGYVEAPRTPPKATAARTRKKK